MATLRSPQSVDTCSNPSVSATSSDPAHTTYSRTLEVHGARSARSSPRHASALGPSFDHADVASRASDLASDDTLEDRCDDAKLSAASAQAFSASAADTSRSTTNPPLLTSSPLVE